MEVDVRIGGERLINFRFFQRQFFQVIASHGMRRMVSHVKAAAGDEMMVELLFVFDRFDAKKGSSETKRSDQENADEALFSDLGGPDCHGHGQTAENEYDRVSSAQFNIECVTADTEGGAERAAVDGVGQEQAAEEQDFGDQENPHAERGGFLLLSERLKMSVQIAGAMHSVLLFLSQCCLAWVNCGAG